MGAIGTRLSLRPLFKREGGTRCKARTKHVVRTRKHDSHTAPHTHRRPGEGRDPQPPLQMVTLCWNDECHPQHPLRRMGPGLRRDDAWDLTTEANCYALLQRRVPPTTFAAAYGFSEFMRRERAIVHPTSSSTDVARMRTCNLHANGTRSLQLVPVGRVSPSHRWRMTSSAAACYSTAAPTGGPPGGRCRKVIDA
ncbi:hypothetical protein ACVIHH_000710 [Bradyrhizobium sp. USDA 4518]